MGKKRKPLTRDEITRAMHAIARVYLFAAAGDKSVVDMATLAIFARNVLEQAISEMGPIALEFQGKGEDACL